MFTRILLPLDGSSLAECVLSHAVAMARATGAEILLVHVLGSEGEALNSESTDPLNWHLRKAEAESYLEEVSGRLVDAGATVHKELLQGKPAERVVKFVQENDVDLLMLSSHGRGGLSSWNVGSVVQKILYRANISIMIIRAFRTENAFDGDVHYRKIMVPLDGSTRAECVLPVVNGLARSEDAEIDLVTVVVRPEMPRRAPLPPEDAALADRVVERNREEAEKYLEQVKAQMEQTVQRRLFVSEDLISTLLDEVENSAYDLVVLSAHGYSGNTRRPFGSVVTSFITHASKPLLIVQDLPQEEIDVTRAEEVAEQTGKSNSGMGGRTIIHAP